jgi:dihydropteroate synthase
VKDHVLLGSGRFLRFGPPAGVMGILNVTPDSFSDGGSYADPIAALDRARVMLEEGAAIVDVGGESTRPGAEPVSVAAELARVRPIVSALALTEACVSVDTRHPQVARACVEAGASILNDVSGFSDPEMVAVASSSDAGVVVMHMRGEPATMQDAPRYDDVAREVRDALAARLAAATAAGIGADHVVLDPGIGFGKTVRHNLELIARLGELAALGRPVLVGASRKRFIGALLDLPVDERLEGGLAAAAAAVLAGARVVRTHDVRATVRAVRVAEAIAAARRG